MGNRILTMSDWESHIASLYSYAIHSQMTHTELQDLTAKHVHVELNRQHGKRKVYTLHIQGFVTGLRRVHDALLYQHHLEYCYLVNGKLYSTHRSSMHPSTDTFYARGEGHLLGKTEVHGHYWRMSEKPFFLGNPS